MSRKIETVNGAFRRARRRLDGEQLEAVDAIVNICYTQIMANFNMRLKKRDGYNLRRVVELTGWSQSEVVRRALEEYRRTVEERIAAEATRAAALQGGMVGA